MRVRALLLGALLLGAAAKGHAQEPCPPGTASHRAGRYQAVTTEADRPVIRLDIELLEFCSTIEDGAVANEILWNLISDSDTQLAPSSLYLVDVRDTSKTFKLPRTQGRWNPYLSASDARMSVPELISAIKVGHIKLVMTDPSSPDGRESSPAKRVYQTAWIPTFRGQRPPRPDHCGPGTVALRSLEALTPTESPAMASIRLIEHDRPLSTVYTQSFNWGVRFEPSLNERVTNVRLMLDREREGPEVVFDFPPVSAEYRELVPSLYSEPSGARGTVNWGNISFREFFELLAAGSPYLAIEAVNPDESFEVPLNVRLFDWHINCT